MHHARSTTVIPATVTNAAAAVFAAVGTGVGIYVLGRASQTFTQHLALVVVASAVAVAAIRFAPGTRTPARTWAIAGIAVTLLGAMALGGVLSRETTVDEQVVTASVPAAGADAESSSTTNGTGATSDAAPKQNVLLKHGEFEPLAHDGKGTASLIRTTDGRTVLT
ncbi:MAG: hypothetical protein KDC46_03055, partial [Thermoleophilia bacterium]|nr:hypothetical protein [Thermoleophilia bacterium]